MNPSETLGAIDILRELVAFDTVSSKSNRALIDRAADRLSDAGAAVFVQHGDEIGKANLFATIGPPDRPGVMLSGHSDVVPVDGEQWSSDPFTLTERDGRLHGRGSADMKAFIACVLSKAPSLAAARLPVPVHVALSYNEETDMRGMRQLIGHLRDAPVRPASCIIGEPTSMRIVIANKGAAVWRCRVRGKPVHSSFRHQGVSAVEIAAEMIVFLNGVQRELEAAERHEGFEYPHTSVQVGRIQGGTAHNITAAECEFVFEVRALPGISAAAIAERLRTYSRDRLLPAMRTVSQECAIEIEEILDAPGLDERGNRHLANALTPLCAHERFGRVSFGTEAGMLQQAGIQTVIMGPGDIGVAHRPDEFVEPAQLGRCLRFLDALGHRLREGVI